MKAILNSVHDTKDDYQLNSKKISLYPNNGLNPNRRLNDESLYSSVDKFLPMTDMTNDGSSFTNNKNNLFNAISNDGTSEKITPKNMVSTTKDKISDISAQSDYILCNNVISNSYKKPANYFSIFQNYVNHYRSYNDDESKNGSDHIENFISTITATPKKKLTSQFFNYNGGYRFIFNSDKGRRNILKAGYNDNPAANQNDKRDTDDIENGKDNNEQSIPESNKINNFTCDEINNFEFYEKCDNETLINLDNNDDFESESHKNNEDSLNYYNNFSIIFGKNKLTHSKPDIHVDNKNNWIDRPENKDDNLLHFTDIKQNLNSGKIYVKEKNNIIEYIDPPEIPRTTFTDKLNLYKLPGNKAMPKFSGITHKFVLEECLDTLLSQDDSKLNDDGDIISMKRL
ncbi:unnamed protein product [Gordionus sp. m RMFG-2023]